MCYLAFFFLPSFTFAGSVRSSQHSALIYAAEGLEEPSDVFIALLLSQHAHKQLSVLCKTRKRACSEYTFITLLLRNTDAERREETLRLWMFTPPPGSSIDYTREREARPAGREREREE